MMIELSMYDWLRVLLFQVLASVLLLLFLIITYYVSNKILNLLGNIKFFGKAFWLIAISENLGLNGYKINTYKNKYGTWEIKLIEQKTNKGLSV